MSPLLIFVLVLLFLVGGLLVLRDTASLRGRKTGHGDTGHKPRRDQRTEAGAGVVATTGEPDTRTRAPDHATDSASDGGSD